MNRIGISNMAWGFLLLFIAACGGAFVALQATENYMTGATTPVWEAAMQQSSHGHTSLFGMLHILMGLTLPYAKSSPRENLLKSLGLFFGSMAMGPLLLIRGALGPTLSTELNGILVGTCLSLALLALLYHAVGLMRRIGERG